MGFETRDLRNGSPALCKQNSVGGTHFLQDSGYAGNDSCTWHKSETVVPKTFCCFAIVILPVIVIVKKNNKQTNLMIYIEYERITLQIIYHTLTVF